jgi:hypothetical protein
MRSTSVRRVFSGPSAWVLAAVLAVLAAAIGLRIFKGCFTGIVYDEAATIIAFCKGFYVAWTDYRNPNNNHVLNSMGINLCLVCFRNCHYFYRIHTIVMSIVYCLSAGYLVWVLIANRLLRFLLAALLVFQSFVFDLSYLGRGYSIALAAFYCGLALLVFLLRKPRPFSRVWLPILVLVLMNFLALGSMLSAMTPVLALNISYILFFSHRAFIAPVRWARSFALHVCGVGVGSAALLYLLYYHIWRDILGARERFGMTFLWGHIRDVLWSSIFASPGTVAKAAYIIFLAVSAAALLYATFMALRQWRLNRSPAVLPPAPQLLVLCTMPVIFAVMYLYRNVAGLSLGFARNGVFLIPIFFLACGILIDMMLASIAGGRLRYVILSLACASLAVTALEARPSLYAVKVSNWSIQSASGPLVRQLQSIDPQRNWSIGITSKTSTLSLGLLFYSHRGFLTQGSDSDFDIVIYHVSDEVDPGVCYKRDFFRNFDCIIILSPAVIQQYSIPAADLSPSRQGEPATDQTSREAQGQPAAL